jgi:two-component system cell cycle sensor histidine kinase PleC
VIAGFEERAAKDRIAVSAEIERGLEVMADPLALDVILRNLFENALAAVAPIGGGSITFIGRRLGGQIELAVRDSGVGFRPADGPRLFQKFSRLHPGGGGSHFGTGLGLYIVRRLMQLEGGQVSARSAGVGQGATLVLAWPAGVAHPDRAPDPTVSRGPLDPQTARREQS